MIYIYIFYIFTDFILDQNISREIKVADELLHIYKYKIPSRPVRFINNVYDRTSLPQRLVGGYRILNPRQVDIIASTSLM